MSGAGAVPEKSQALPAATVTLMQGSRGLATVNERATRNGVGGRP